MRRRSHDFAVDGPATDACSPGPHEAPWLDRTEVDSLFANRRGRPYAACRLLQSKRTASTTDGRPNPASICEPGFPVSPIAPSPAEFPRRAPASNRLVRAPGESPCPLEHWRTEWLWVRGTPNFRSVACHFSGDRSLEKIHPNPDGSDISCRDCAATDVGARLPPLELAIRQPINATTGRSELRHEGRLSRLPAKGVAIDKTRDAFRCMAPE